jgi:hypothetical protein
MASSHRCRTHQWLVLRSSKLQRVMQWVMLYCSLLQTKVHAAAKDVQQKADTADFYFGCLMAYCRVQVGKKLSMPLPRRAVYCTCHCY